MKVGKWNGWSYDEYELPVGAKLYSDDMDEVISCAGCGKQIKVDDGYTSLEIHTNAGFGFIVCETCYQQELKRRNQKATDAESLNRCLSIGTEQFLTELGYQAKKHGMSKLAKEIGVGRESLYKSLSGERSPSASTVFKVVRALGYNIEFRTKE